MPMNGPDPSPHDVVGEEDRHENTYQEKPQAKQKRSGQGEESLSEVKGNEGNADEDGSQDKNDDELKLGVDQPNGYEPVDPFVLDEVEVKKGRKNGK